MSSESPLSQPSNRGAGREATRVAEGREPGPAPTRATATSWTIFAVFAVAYFFSYFYRSANAVIADDLTRDLGLAPAQLGLMTSLFFLAFAAAQIPLGSALDRFGSRYVTPGLMTVGVLGSVMFGLAQDLATLAVARALIGLGMAGVLMGSLKALSGWFPLRQFASVSGMFLGVGSLGALAAATPLAALNEAVGWRAAFLGAAGIVLLAAAAIALVARPAPGSAGSRATASAGSVTDVFGSVTFWRIGMLGFALTGSMFAYQGLWAGPYLTDRAGLEPITAGNLLLLMGLGVSGGYMLVGLLADRLGIARVAAAGAVGMILVQLMLAFLPSDTGVGWLAALFLLFGLAGSFSVLFFAHVREVFPHHMTGRAITAVNLLGIGGSALLQWVLGAVIGTFGTSEAGGYPARAYTAAFLVTTVLLMLTLPFYWPLTRRSEAPGGDVGPDGTGR